MKVITEERLRQIRESMPDGMSKLFVHGLISQCQELDQLTVTKLRPMSDAPRDGTSLMICLKHNKTFWKAECYLPNGQWVLPGLDSLNEELLDGWIPLPTYKPEQS